MLFEATTDGITGRLSITAVDQRSHQLTLCLPDGIVDVQEPGVALVPYDYLPDVLNKLPGAESISLEVDTNNKMIVKCNLDQFDVFLHQGDPDDFRLAIIDESQLPEEICTVNGNHLSQLITDSIGIINDQEDFKLIGEGDNLHAFAHDRNSSIVSHVTVEAKDQVEDWSISVVSKLVKLINKYWLDDVSVHLKTGDGAMLAFKCNHDFFVIRQLMTDIDVSMLQEALKKDSVGYFIADGTLLKNKSKMLDLAKSDIKVEVAKNTLRFSSSYASRGNNDVQVILDAMHDQQPSEKFLKDLLKRAISALDVTKVQGEWVPFNEDGTSFFLRLVDADLPEFKQVLITPVQ
jgi:DNA polymerase III sliding clamp (beta) subunit (PCNA family)